MSVTWLAFGVALYVPVDVKMPVWVRFAGAAGRSEVLSEVRWSLTAEVRSERAPLMEGEWELGSCGGASWWGLAWVAKLGGPSRMLDSGYRNGSRGVLRLEVSK